MAMRRDRGVSGWTLDYMPKFTTALSGICGTPWNEVFGTSCRSTRVYIDLIALNRLSAFLRLSDFKVPR